MKLNFPIKNALEKLQIVSKSKYDQRIKTCSNCTEFGKANGSIMCGHCGCVMTLKARLLTARCPLWTDW